MSNVQKPVTNERRKKINPFRYPSIVTIDRFAFEKKMKIFKFQVSMEEKKIKLQNQLVNKTKKKNEWMNEIYQSSSEMKELTKKKNFSYIFFFLWKKTFSIWEFYRQEKKTKLLIMFTVLAMIMIIIMIIIIIIIDDCHCGWKKMTLLIRSHVINM